MITSNETYAVCQFQLHIWFWRGEGGVLFSKFRGGEDWLKFEEGLRTFKLLRFDKCRLLWLLIMMNMLYANFRSTRDIRGIKDGLLSLCGRGERKFEKFRLTPKIFQFHPSHLIWRWVIAKNSFCKGNQGLVLYLITKWFQNEVWTKFEVSIRRVEQLKFEKLEIFQFLWTKGTTYFKLNFFGVFGMHKVRVLNLVIDMACKVDKSTPQYYLRM